MQPGASYRCHAQQSAPIMWELARSLAGVPLRCCGTCSAAVPAMPGSKSRRMVPAARCIATQPIYITGVHVQLAGWTAKHCQHCLRPHAGHVRGRQRHGQQHQVPASHGGAGLQGALDLGAHGHPEDRPCHQPQEQQGGCGVTVTMEKVLPRGVPSGGAGDKIQGAKIGAEFYD